MKTRSVGHWCCFLTLVQGLPLFKAEDESNVCRSGPCNRKKTENQTGPDWLGPDWWLQLHAFQTMQPDQFGLIATGFKGNLLQPVVQVIPLKNLHILSPFWGEMDQNYMSYGQNDMFRQNPTLCDIS